MIVRPLGLAFLVALGTGLAWALAVLWGLTVIDQFLGTWGIMEYLQVRADGTPIIQTYQFGSGDLPNRTWRTLQGDAIPEKRSPNQVGQLGGVWLMGARPLQRPFTLIPWERRIVWVLGNSESPTTSWFLVYGPEPASRGYFVGYDLKTKTCVGYIGRRGFHRQLPPEEERFDIDGRRISDRQALYGACSVLGGPGGSIAHKVSGKGWMVYLISGDELLEVNVETRSVRLLFQSPGLMAVGRAPRAVRALPEDEYYRVAGLPNNVIVRFEDRIVVIDPQEGDRRQYAIPAEVRRANFHFYELADEGALLYTIRPSPGGEDIRLYWVDGTEQVVRQEELVLRMARSVRLADQRWAASLAAPSPLVEAVVTATVRPLYHRTEGHEEDYPAALRRSLAESWPGALVVVAVAGGLTWACRRRQRQYGLAWGPVWAAFVFLFGVPGFLGYLCHRTWPARIACPRCRGEVPRDRESCFACGAEFPQPAPKSIEVFA